MLGWEPLGARRWGAGGTRDTLALGHLHLVNLKPVLPGIFS